MREWDSPDRHWLKTFSLHSVLVTVNRNRFKCCVCFELFTRTLAAVLSTNPEVFHKQALPSKRRSFPRMVFNMRSDDWSLLAFSSVYHFQADKLSHHFATCISDFIVIFTIYEHNSSPLSWHGLVLLGDSDLAHTHHNACYCYWLDVSESFCL